MGGEFEPRFGDHCDMLRIDYQSSCSCQVLSKVCMDEESVHHPRNMEAERSGSVVECLTRDRRATGSSLRCVLEQDTFILA